MVQAFVNSRCEWDKCSEKGMNYIFGHSYCGKHYRQAIEKHFFIEYDLWDKQFRPTRKFLNLFARFIESIYIKKPFKKSYLTPGRIKDRTYDITANADTIEFKIVRHFNAWNEVKPVRYVEQHWSFDVVKKELDLLSENDTERRE